MNFTDIKLSVLGMANERTDISDSDLSFAIKTGQEKLEDYLVSQGINPLDMEAFSSSVTPAIPSGVETLSLPTDYLKMLAFNITNQLPSPVITLSAAAGTLGAGTYYYRVSATNTLGETIPSLEVSQILAATGGVKIDWVQITGATGYKVYGRSTGAELLIATISSGATVTYTDDGSITPAGAMPTRNTSGSAKYEVLDRISASRYSMPTGRPEKLEIKGRTLYFNKITDQTYAYEMFYLKRLAALSDSNMTNTWSNNFSNALIYASIVELIPGYFIDDIKAVGWKKARDEQFTLMGSIIKADRGNP